MKLSGKSLRPFIGAKNYSISRKFYTDLGFTELVIDPKMSYFGMADFGFYLQDYYSRDWVDNTMLFFEIEDLEHSLGHIQQLCLTDKYKGVRLSKIVHRDWGSEFFLHDPSGILWHFGSFELA